MGDVYRHFRSLLFVEEFRPPPIEKFQCRGVRPLFVAERAKDACSTGERHRDGSRAVMEDDRASEWNRTPLGTVRRGLWPGNLGSANSGYATFTEATQPGLTLGHVPMVEGTLAGLSQSDSTGRSSCSESAENRIIHVRISFIVLPTGPLAEQQSAEKMGRGRDHPGERLGIHGAASG